MLHSTSGVCVVFCDARQTGRTREEKLEGTERKDT
jgi:hypothetical protein